MGGRASVRKGKQGEGEVVRLLSQVWPEAHRSGHLQRNSGIKVPDVDGTPYWVEVKRGKRINVRLAMAQAELDAEGDARPAVVIYREDGRRDWWVCMTIEEMAWSIGGGMNENESLPAHMELKDWLAGVEAWERVDGKMQPVPPGAGPDGMWGMR